MSVQRDTLEVELVDAPDLTGGVLDNFTSFQLVLDQTMPSEVSFELGDDGTFAQIARAIAAGQRYKVRVCGRTMLTGRVEANDAPLDAAAGAVARFTVRTKMSDAFYGSADMSISVKGTLLDFLLAVYEPIARESDFVFRASLARDLRTGRPSGGKGKDTDVKLTQLKVDQARVQPGESIYAAADRHLRRFGLMHWDGPDDTIVVGYPNQAQDPLYTLLTSRAQGRRARNNVLAGTRAQDYSGLPSHVAVFGSKYGAGASRVRVEQFAVDQDVVAAGFHRPVNIVAEGIRNDVAAKNAAERELAARVKQKDVINYEADGFSHRSDDGARTPYVPDTVAEVESDVAGGNMGAYYLTRVELTRDAQRGDNARITAIRAGLWRLFPEAYEGALE